MSLNYSSGIEVANIYDGRNNKIQDIFYEDIDENNHRPITSLKITNGNHYYFPALTNFEDEEQRMALLVGGKSGCGKTTFISIFVKKWMQKNKGKPVFLFSSKTEDAKLDSIKGINRVEITEDLIINPITLDEIAIKGKSLCLFDDISDFSNSKITKEIKRLLLEILRNGRSRNIDIIYVNHDLTSGYETKLLILEATGIVLFPKRSASGTYQYLLEKKLRINKENINLITKLNSSYVYIHTNHPNVIISDKYILVN